MLGGASGRGTTCLLHDALGRLTAVGMAKAVLPGAGALACQSENDIMSFSARFEYDAMNRRVARQDGTVWTEYVHDPGGNLLAELTRPATAGGTWATNREYAWLDGQPLAQVEYPAGGPADGYTYYFHLDHLGQPRALTNGAGTTVWKAVPARPYGDVVETITPDNGRTVVTNLRLPGQYHERGGSPTDAGLLASVGLQGPYYNWNRWYLPSMGRYMELDPIAAAGGFNGFYGPNWYGYVDQNPLRWTDPFGLCKVWCSTGGIPGVTWLCFRASDDFNMLSSSTFEGLYLGPDIPATFLFMDSCKNWDDPKKVRVNPLHEFPLVKKPFPDACGGT